MCMGFEGVLIEIEGTGITRTGLLRVGQRDFAIGLACVPEAMVGDVVIAHSGQGVRVVASDGDDVGEGSGVRLESESLIDSRRVGVTHLVDIEHGSVQHSG
jgi:hypothetical protein